MACKCRICGVNDVARPGDVCGPCRSGQPADAAGSGGKRTRRVLLNGGSGLSDLDPYGNSMGPQDEAESPDQTPPADHTAADDAVQGSQPLTCGVIKNIMVDTPRKSALGKWFRTLFTGIPFSLSNEVTLFQVFPDPSGSPLNMLGNACDQVIVYGKIKYGSLAENNDVEVYGRRDSNNYIIAREIRNKATGTAVRPEHTLGVLPVWIITILLAALLACAAVSLGRSGVSWILIFILFLLLSIGFLILRLFFSFLRNLFR